MFLALSNAWRPARASQFFTLRELRMALERARHHAVPSPSRHLERLLASVSDDLAVAVRNPERRGGPDTLRSLAAWKSRYNRLERYLPRA